MADLPDFLNFRRQRRNVSTPMRSEQPDDLSQDVDDESADSPRSISSAVNPAAPSIPDDQTVVPPPVAEPSPVAQASAAQSGPTVSGAVRRSLGPAPLMRQGGTYVNRPEYDDTGDRGGDLENYREQLDAFRDPPDQNGRVKTGLKEAARGFLQGFLQGGLAGGVRGAAVRGIRGAVTPNLDEREARDREIARVEGAEERVRGQQAWQQKLAEAQADINVKNANADWLRQKPVIEQTKADGTAENRTVSQLEREYRSRSSYDPTDPAEAAEPNSLTNRAKAAGISFGKKDKTHRPGFIIGGVRYEYGDDNLPRVATDAVTGKPIEDASKKPDAQGLLPRDVMRQQIADNNLKYRQNKDAAALAERQKEFAGRMSVAQGNLAERIKSRLDTEAARKVAQGQAATRVKIAVSKARAWAQKEGASWDDFVDGLDANGVEIVPDK